MGGGTTLTPAGMETGVGLFGDVRSTYGIEQYGNGLENYPENEAKLPRKR